MTDLLELVAASRRNVDQLSSPSTLADVANQIGSFAATHGITNIVAASPLAERVVGAALLLLSQKQHGFSSTTGEPSAKIVLLIDINIASGTAMAHAARKARTGGADHVQGLVLHALSATIGHLECGLDALQVLDLPTLAPTGR